MTKIKLNKTLSTIQVSLIISSGPSGLKMMKWKSFHWLTDLQIKMLPNEKK